MGLGVAALHASLRPRFSFLCFHLSVKITRLLQGGLFWCTRRGSNSQRGRRRPLFYPIRLRVRKWNLRQKNQLKIQYNLLYFLPKNYQIFLLNFLLIQSGSFPRCKHTPPCPYGDIILRSPSPARSRVPRAKGSRRAASYLREIRALPHRSAYP